MKGIVITVILFFSLFWIGFFIEDKLYEKDWYYVPFLMTWIILQIGSLVVFFACLFDEHAEKTERVNS